MALAASGTPTLYEYYAGDGITAGLSDDQSYFTLNNKNITIYSGAFHYFRVPRAYWRDRLRKMRAAGLNTVETYIPWNLHEPQSGIYDFGEGSSDFEDFLHVEEFLKTAQEEDLLALVRPGPYICAEWEFGGLPSWLLRNTTSVRSSKDENYIEYVKRYFNVLLPILALLQFQNGGPIIGFQIENEYASTLTFDIEYLRILQQMFLDNNIKELLYTSNSAFLSLLSAGSIPGVLDTANFNSVPSLQLLALQLKQTNKPLMTMEYWTGWYDYWGGKHDTGSDVDIFRSQVEEVLNYPSSINFYMFVGSTNFGFLNGANTYIIDPINLGLQPITTSYDYGSPITEYGNYTEKYDVVKEIVASHNEVNTTLPLKPEETNLRKYPSIEPTGQILLSAVIDDFVDKIESEDIIPMEYLPINNNSGQSFGYIVYRKTNLDLSAGAELKISGFVRDTVLVLLNGKLVSPVPKTNSDLWGFGFWKAWNSQLTLTTEDLQNVTLDLVVENFGRNGFGLINMFRQFKGLTDDVYIDDEKISGWEIVPLEFKKSWNNNNLRDWKTVNTTIATPAFYQFTHVITGTPEDTYIDLRNWTKGIIIVNGFVLGRHFFLGPQQALYLPAPLLQSGTNSIIVFEHYNAPDQLDFADQPIFEEISKRVNS